MRNLKNTILTFSITMIICSFTFANDIYEDFASYKDFITTEQMIPYFMESFSNNAYLSENGYHIVPQSATLTLPDSTVAITAIGAGAFVGSLITANPIAATGTLMVAVIAGTPSSLELRGTNIDINPKTGIVDGVIHGLGARILITTNFVLLGIKNSAYSFLGLLSTAGATFAFFVAMTTMAPDDIHNFYANRLAFHFNLLDKDQRPVRASCLAYFAYIPSEHTLDVEPDACYLQTFTGLEDAPVIKMPQTVDGVVRLDDTTPFIGGWDDWFQGQAKVVDVFTIPLPEENEL